MQQVDLTMHVGLHDLCSFIFSFQILLFGHLDLGLFGIVAGIKTFTYRTFDSKTFARTAFNKSHLFFGSYISKVLHIITSIW